MLKKLTPMKLRDPAHGWRRPLSTHGNEGNTCTPKAQACVFVVTAVTQHKWFHQSTLDRFFLQKHNRSAN